jgi:hypothetical protein
LSVNWLQTFIQVFFFVFLKEICIYCHIVEIIGTGFVRVFINFLCFFFDKHLVWIWPQKNRVHIDIALFIFCVCYSIQICVEFTRLCLDLNVIKKPDCFRTTNFILLIVLCWTTVFRKYLYNKLNDRKKITTQYLFSLSCKQIIIFIFLLQHNHLF